MTGLLIALALAVLVGLFWWLVERYGHTQDRPPRQPDPALHEAQHRVSDTGERPGDDDQWRRLKPMAPHIRRLANAEKRAEEVDDV